MVCHYGCNGGREKFATTMENGLSSWSAFREVYKDGITFAWVSEYISYDNRTYTAGAITKSSSRIEFASMASDGIVNSIMAQLRGINHVIHELGHAFSGTDVGKGSYEALGTDMDLNPSLKRDNPVKGYSYGFASGYEYLVYQMSHGDADEKFEIFADMFVGWTTDSWFTGEFPYGWGADMGSLTADHVRMAEQKSLWIDKHMKQRLGPVPTK